MTCREGFDPFGDRDARLLAHAERCAHCADVLHVLGACGAAWKEGLANDAVRAPYRARRLGRARPPARKAMTTLVLAVVVAALSGYALARRANPRAPDAAATATAADPIAPPLEAPRPVAPRHAPPPEPEPSVEPSAETPAPEAPAPHATAPTPAESSRELWTRANALLDAGDRAGAEQAFRQVMDLPSAEPGLRSRATFRWAQLLLSRGDTRTPREPLFRLVRAKDAPLGFDAALLLERCAPEERARIWETYLAVTTDPALRERALQHEKGPAAAEGR